MRPPHLGLVKLPLDPAVPGAPALHLHCKTGWHLGRNSLELLWLGICYNPLHELGCWTARPILEATKSSGRAELQALGFNPRALFHSYSTTPLNLLLWDEGSSAPLPALSDFLPALPAALLTVICDLWPVLAQSQKPKIEASW